MQCELVFPRLHLGSILLLLCLLSFRSHLILFRTTLQTARFATTLHLIHRVCWSLLPSSGVQAVLDCLLVYRVSTRGHLLLDLLAAF